MSMWGCEIPRSWSSRQLWVTWTKLRYSVRASSALKPPQSFLQPLSLKFWAIFLVNNFYIFKVFVAGCCWDMITLHSPSWSGFCHNTLVSASHMLDPPPPVLIILKYQTWGWKKGTVLGKDLNPSTHIRQLTTAYASTLRIPNAQPQTRIQHCRLRHHSNTSLDTMSEMYLGTRSAKYLLVKYKEHLQLPPSTLDSQRAQTT